jgi:hypothetical protein
MTSHAPPVLPFSCQRSCPPHPTSKIALGRQSAVAMPLMVVGCSWPRVALLLLLLLLLLRRRLATVTLSSVDPALPWFLAACRSGAAPPSTPQVAAITGVIAHECCQQQQHLRMPCCPSSQCWLRPERFHPAARSRAAAPAT